MSVIRYQVSVLRPEYEKLQMSITQQRVIQSNSCLVLGWGFRGRRIERRHFRLDQIQDGVGQTLCMFEHVSCFSYNLLSFTYM